MFNPKKEFSRFAHSYREQNIIQTKIAKHLKSLIFHRHYDTVLELGCGSGEMFELIDFSFSRYTALDISKNMCELHPKDKRLQLLNIDFDDESFFENKKYDLVISSSALQWSKDIDKLMQNISKTTSNIAFSIFTSNTFKTLHQIANISSPIYDKKIIIDCVQKYFDVNIETKEYTLTFENNIDIFRYIKNSGVSGGLNRLSYKQTKDLINNYPLNYLEFEVLFFTSKE